MNHLYHRLNRIACDVTLNKDYSGCVELYKHTLAKLNSVKDSALDPLAFSGSEFPAPTASPALPVNITVCCEGNSANAFSKLKFDGKSCVRAFIQRIDEFCKAKNDSYGKILTNATEIFTGEAIHWFRSVRDSVSTWDELVILLKRDFDQSDYDYRLLSEIRSRTQGESENIVIYLSIMSGLFSRLSNKLSEADQLEIILHNIRPCYANILCSVSELKTIEELKSVCRNYESVQARLSQFKEPPRLTPHTLAPEFAYSGSSQHKQNLNYNNKFNSHSYGNNPSTQNNNYNNNKASTYNNNRTNNTSNNYVHTIDSFNRKTRYCPRCRTDAHNLRQCTASKDEIFCFVCGRKGVKTPDCPDCLKNRKPVSKN